MENEKQDLRQLLKVSVDIIDGYVQALQRKDEVILRYASEIERLQQENTDLRSVAFDGIVAAEVSE